jgi:nicotinamide phosphoribosyltransferase
MSSIILNTDSYKTSHFEQYPPLTEKINSYIEARGIDDSFPRVKSTLFFGLQMFIKKYLLTPITKEDIREAEEIFDLHGVPFNRAGWETILHKHGGYLPIEIYALPEGTHVPLRTPLVQVRNTDEALPWLTSYVETALLRAIWYPTTVATLSSHIKNVVLHDYMSKTAEDESAIDFMLHDFGARGASSLESAGIGGLAHLVNFKGTDTIEALVNARKYYHATMAGFSIPAAEHSTITSWGKDGEYQAYNNMVDKFGEKLYAVVSDSYDLYNAIENVWCKQLREKVIAKGGRLVVRPDSGDPLVVVPKSIELLGAGFGYTVNKKGYKVLHPSVRLIQGDGVNVKSIDGILYELMKAGWSAENVVFGMGGALLQKVDRDTLKFAMKASSINKSGHWSDVYKDPKTDPGKSSKKGVLAVMDNFVTIRAEDVYLTNKYVGQTDQLGLIFDNGDLIVDETFDTIRERAKVA